MTLLALAGAPCTGKSTAADVLESLGYPVVSMGEELRERVSGEGDEVWEYAESLREEHGEHGVATVCVEPLKEALREHELAVIEGCRTPVEVEYLQGACSTATKILWFTAPFEDRVDWFSGREGRGESFETREDAADKLQERTRREEEAGAGRFQVIADYRIHNNGSRQDLAYEVKNVVWTLTA